MMKSADRLMIAGATGLIGSACVRHFSALDNFELFTPTRKELELTDRVAIFEYVTTNKISSIIFAAGRVGGIVENNDHPATLLDENIVVGLNGLWAAHKASIDRMIVFGSSCMYPTDAPQPMREAALMTGKIEQTSVAYATAKLALVQAALAYNRQYPKGTFFVPVIPNSTYGPCDDFDSRSSHVMAALIRKIHIAKQMDLNEIKIWGTGKPRREFVYSDDVASACAVLLNADLSTLDEPINITSGDELSIADLAHTIAEVIGYRGRFVFDTSMPDGASRKALCGEKMSALGWLPSCSIVDGISQSYEWFQQNLSSDECSYA